MLLIIVCTEFDIVKCRYSEGSVALMETAMIWNELSKFSKVCKYNRLIFATLKNKLNRLIQYKGYNFISNNRHLSGLFFSIYKYI